MTPPSEHSCTQTSRIESIEVSVATVHEKLDRITDILISNARTEEQLKAVKEKVAAQEKAIGELMAYKNESKPYMKAAERLLWLLVLGGVAYFKVHGG